MIKIAVKALSLTPKIWSIETDPKIVPLVNVLLDFQIRTLYKKSVLCFKSQEKCYGALYGAETADAKSARSEMAPRKIFLPNKFLKLEL